MNIKIECIHGVILGFLLKDKNTTERELIIERFRKGEIWVLITTDLLSRGIDFKGVNLVLNYDFP